MFRFRLRKLSRPRWKKGRPHHSTTGVASANSIQSSQIVGTLSVTPGRTWRDMAITKTGAAKTRLTRKRRVISTSSSFGPSSAVIVIGSSAMPHFGQEPGPSCTISGCIGQVYMAPGGASAGAWGTAAPAAST